MVRNVHKAANMGGPTVFDYDGVYEKMEAAKEEKKKEVKQVDKKVFSPAFKIAITAAVITNLVLKYLETRYFCFLP